MNRTTFLILFIALALPGCAIDEAERGVEVAVRAEKVERVEKGGALLWEQNCRRCHNLRPPSAYSDDEWDVIVNHMRVRARLTAEESRKIAQFLKAAN
ncbi:MAG TPA: cytochrome c [Planctomycetota bacterium]|nr:cytochrome c [Planctomycetota bacterium]